MVTEVVVDFVSTADNLQLPQFESECASKTITGWTEREDALLTREAKRLNHVWGKWGLIAMQLPGRSGKQCRERWHNCVGPHVSNHPWTAEEDMAIQVGVKQHGHKWTFIAASLEGRTDHAVKNRYHTSIASAIMRQGQPGQEEMHWSDEAFLRELTRRNAANEAEKNPTRYHKLINRKHRVANPPQEPEPASEPEPDPEEPMPSLRMIDQLTKHADDPNLQFMAIEDYSEGTDESWMHSSVLVVGKPGLSFAFAARGKTIPPPPPTQVVVIASPVPSLKKMETVERWEWVKKRWAADPDTSPRGQLWVCEPRKKEKGKEAMATETTPEFSEWRTDALKQYYKQQKLRYRDVPTPKKASDEECRALAGEELVKTVFV